MIAAKVVTEVRRLLTEKAISQRKIARLTGVSRGTVGAIASGKRPDYETLQHMQNDEWEEPAGPPARCPGCGGMVYTPCRLCLVRKMEAEKRRSSPRIRAVPLAEPLRLDLRPEHRGRYAEVRAWRQKNRCHSSEGSTAS